MEIIVFGYRVPDFFLILEIILSVSQYSEL